MSAAICLATVVLWVRGYWREDALTLRWQPSARSAFWYDGTIYGGSGILGLDTSQYRIDKTRHPFEWEWSSLDAADVAYTRSASTWVEKIGFYCFIRTEQQEQQDLQNSQGLFMRVNSGWARVEAPAWLFAAIFGSVPAWRLLVMRRERARKKGNLCEHCGYDLRATPAKCPECGRVVSSKIARNPAVKAVS